MKKTLRNSLAVLTLLAGGEAMFAQAIDWPTFGGDIERSGQGKSEIKITKDEVTKNFKLLWKMQQRGTPSLMAPLVLGRLIGYRGFKELAFFGGSDDSLYVMDADMDRLYWQTKFVPPINAPAPTAECPGGMTAMPSLIPVSVRRSHPSTRKRFEAGFGGPRSIYLISSDGMLRRVNVANGNESGMPFQIFPANSRVSALNIDEGMIYATTSHGCGGAGNGVWGIDLATPDPSTAPEVTTLMTGPANYAGIGGPVIGKDGDVFVQTLDGPNDPANGKYSNALLALEPKTLAVKGYFIDSSSGSAPKGDLNSVTPVTFEYKDHEVIASVSRDGHLNLLDEKSLAAQGDHKTPLAQSPRIPTGNDGGLWGSLTTWADPADKTRYILATVWGNASGRNGSIAAYKLEEKDGKTVFTPVWTMPNLIRPVPPVVIGGLAFVLSSGEGRKNAVLHVVDSLTGTPVWSTKNEITAPGNLTPLTVANGRVYLVTADSTVWVFGLPLEL
ncbi:MAG TPA: PQQ-binding-like beta-propeller repeat protein [Bryobacteraceae bacterium]|jgi:hypothetical protein